MVERKKIKQYFQKNNFTTEIVKFLTIFIMQLKTKTRIFCLNISNEPCSPCPSRCDTYLHQSYIIQ